MTPTPTPPARSRCGRPPRSRSPSEFAAAIIEPPKLLGIVDVTPGVVTIGLTATVRAGDQDGYLRAVRAAIKSAFDQALADDPPADFRPPLITPPADGRMTARLADRAGRSRRRPESTLAIGAGQ